MKLMTFEQYIVERFGKTLYQIELEIAVQKFLGGAPVDMSWESAEIFTDGLRARYEFERDT